MNNHITAAIKWLSESDIRNKDEQKPSFGGINNGYLWIDKTYQYVYNEITGYAVNAFLNMHKWLNDDKYLQYSRNAADYLISQRARNANAFEYGAVSHSLIHPDLEKVGNYYSFDNAMILHGMVNLHKISNEKRYLDACIDIGNWLLKMQKEDGSFYSYFDAENNVVHHPYDEFFFDNGCLHVKNAIGLMYLNRFTNGDGYYRAGLKICNWGEGLQDRDGIFWANTRKKYVFTHAHCYATEGYLCAYHLSKKENYLGVARKAGDALIPLQNPDGSLYRIYKRKFSMKTGFGEKYRSSFRKWTNERKYPWKTIDATAQAARIWALLYSFDNEEKYLVSTQKALDFIKKNQVLNTEDQNMYGGHFYQLCDHKREKEIGLSRWMYTWCTQFALSAYMIATSAENNVAFDELITTLF